MRPISIRGAYIVKSVVVYAVYACVLLFCFTTLYTQTPGIRQYDVRRLNITFGNFFEQYYVHRPPANACDGVEVLILIPSRPTGMGLDFRNQIRDSWLAKEQIPPGYGYRFVVGVPTEKTASRISRLEAMLMDEQKENNDLIIYNLNDSYTDLHVKTYILMQWQQEFCPTAKYLLKADDDTAIDLRRLKTYVDMVFELKRKIYPHLVFGMALRGYPIRDQGNKWYVSKEEFPADEFPLYCNGAMYLMSTTGVRRILEVARTAKAIHIEDVFFTGVLAEKAGVVRFGVDSFVSPFTVSVGKIFCGSQ
uniref:Hexosyltransferase n=1 Tax=Bursaphelenchus xylophilus TaxID=6326 RepID=A0A1I7RMF7_BURXY